MNVSCAVSVNATKVVIAVQDGVGGMSEILLILVFGSRFTHLTLSGLG